MAYEKMEKEELILRDELAIERTKLAEERTYLAYIRTGMNLVLGGMFFVGYFKEGLFRDIGFATLAIGIAFLGYGFYNHKKSRGFVENLVRALKDIEK